MIKVADLPRGWTLWVSDECHEINLMPFFVHRDGRRRRAMEVAMQPEAPELMRDLKRQLDIADKTRKLARDDTQFRGLDMAKLSLQLALQSLGRFSPEMLQTGVGA